jgi:hypothetical protein
MISSGLSNLAGVLVEQDRASEAEPLLRESLAIRQASQPEELTTFINQTILGGVLLRQNKLAEAEPLLLDGYKALKDREGELSSSGRARLTDAAEQIAKLYEMRAAAEPGGGYDALAAEWKARVAGEPAR